MADPQMIRCTNCGALNRVPAERVQQGLAPVCGQCKTPLALPSEPLVVTDATFANEVERSPLPVLVDLWAPWCGPCRVIAPILEQLATEMSGRMRFAKLNVDENPVTQERFNVQGIPTLLIMSGGHEIDRIVGAYPKPEIARRLEGAIAAATAKESAAKQ
jgi:thioredoxin 2